MDEELYTWEDVDIRAILQPLKKRANRPYSYFADPEQQKEHSMSSHVIIAAQLERGMRIYEVSQPGKPIRLARSMALCEAGDLVVGDSQGNFQIFRVVCESHDFTLQQASESNWWIVSTINGAAEEGHRLRQEERNAEQRLARSRALQEAREAMRLEGIENAAELFLPK